MKKRCGTKEDINKKGRFQQNGQSRKRGLNRSISDASWYSLTKKIEYLAAKQGKVFERVNPRFTSQICSCCGHKDKASRSKEKFICTDCGHHADADINAARNIKKRGIEIYSFPVSCKVKIKMVPEDFREPKQRFHCLKCPPLNQQRVKGDVPLTRANGRCLGTRLNS